MLMCTCLMHGGGGQGGVGSDTVSCKSDLRGWKKTIGGIELNRIILPRVHLVATCLFAFAHARAEWQASSLILLAVLRISAPRTMLQRRRLRSEPANSNWDSEQDTPTCKVVCQWRRD